MLVHRSHYALLTTAFLTMSMTGAITIPAFANDVEHRSVEVKYRDLDLTTETGVAALKHRIGRAADEACGPVETRPLESYNRFTACRSAAVAAALPHVDAVIAAAQDSKQYASARGSTLTIR